jgi:hypothetical protein
LPEVFDDSLEKCILAARARHGFGNSLSEITVEAMRAGATGTIQEKIDLDALAATQGPAET